jgi:hypothetical protein
MSLIAYVCGLCEDSHHNKFYCSDCINSSLNTKKQAFTRVLQQKLQVEDLLKNKLQSLQNKSNSFLSHSSHQQQLTLLQQSILSEQQQLTEVKQVIKNQKLQLHDTTKAMAKSRAIMALMKDKKINKYFMEKQPKYSNYLGELNKAIVKLQKHHVETLLSNYVIKRVSGSSCSICSLTLPDDCEYIEYDNNNPENNETVAAALGYLVFVLQQISKYLDCYLPYQLTYFASNSFITYQANNDDKNHINNTKNSVNTNFIIKSFTSISSNTADTNINDHKYNLRMNSSASQNLEQFRRAIFLLAHNINYLALYTGVDMQQLKLFHLLPNTLLIIQAIQLNIKNRDIIANNRSSLIRPKADHTNYNNVPPAIANDNFIVNDTDDCQHISDENSFFNNAFYSKLSTAIDELFPHLHNNRHELVIPAVESNSRVAVAPINQSSSATSITPISYSIPDEEYDMIQVETAFEV